MNILFYKCATPLHIGSGQDLGYIKMPIQRERHTSFPIIEASGIKGAFRSHYARSEKGASQNNDKAIFGEDENSNEAHAGSLLFFDARILFFPVKTREGIFRWITCPYVLQRFITDIENLMQEEMNINHLEEMSNLLKEGQYIPFYETDSDKNIFLEEHEFCMEKMKAGMDKTFREIKKQLGTLEAHMKDPVIISDNDFKYFVEMCTEVNTRIEMDDECGIAKEGHLFTEEYVPSETIFYTFMDVQEIERVKNQNIDPHVLLQNIVQKIKIIQMGGNKTLGKGLIRVIEGGPKNA